MEERYISLRRAKKSDMMFYLRLRNDPSVREAAFDTKPVDIATHHAWFSQKLKNPNSYLFVIESEKDPIGQVRIEVKGSDGEIHIALVPEHRGKGYAPLAISQACTSIFHEYKDMKRIIAHIKEDNVASQKSFQKAGFVHKGIVHYKGTQCLRMEYPLP